MASASAVLKFQLDIRHGFNLKTDLKKWKLISKISPLFLCLSLSPCPSWSTIVMLPLENQAQCVQLWFHLLRMLRQEDHWSLAHDSANTLGNSILPSQNILSTMKQNLKPPLKLSTQFRKDRKRLQRKMLYVTSDCLTNDWHLSKVLLSVQSAKSEHSVLVYSDMSISQDWTN